MGERKEEINHDVIIKAKKHLEMTGIDDVSSFDETEILAKTGNIGVSIEGEGLKIEKFDAEKGELIINGEITGVFYYPKDPPKKKKPFSFFK